MFFRRKKAFASSAHSTGQSDARTVREIYKPYCENAAYLAFISQEGTNQSMQETFEQTSVRLTAEAMQTAPAQLPDYLARNAPSLLPEGRAFAHYMRRKLREKGILQQDVFLAADLSENYGYKLIAQEKHTVSRDVILRLCFASRFTTEETQEALALYGMAPLRGRIARDAVLLAAFSVGMRDIHDADALLRAHGQAPLLADGTD